MAKEEETKDTAETEDATKTEKDADADAAEEAVPEPEDDDVVAVANAVAEAETEDAAVEAGAAAGDDGGAPKRRFFPRVRHLLQPEWEYFLSGVLNSIESSGAHNGANASHKASNPWYKAFHSIYGGVASDCSVPTGKNRYHKFKDKIVELWTAMEQAEAHPLKDMGVRQYNAYKQALDTRPPAVGAAPNGDSPSKPAAAGTDKTGTTTTEGSAKPAVGAPKSTLVVKRPPTMNTMGLSKAVTNTAGAAVGAAAKAMINNKRAASAVGGPMGSSNYPPPTQWLHLDEGVVLLRIPQPLQSLLHLRHMGVEVQSQDTVLVEEAYQRALNDFLDAPTLLITTTVKDSAAGASEEKASGKSPGDLYALCQSMVLLWRCAKRLQKSQESKAILYTYHNIVQEYLQSIQQEHDQETDKETPSTTVVTEI